MSTKKPAAQLDREIAEALASPTSRGGSSYEEARIARDALEAEVDDADKALKAFPRGPMGLPPENVRVSPQYREANARFQTAFAALRKFNTVFTKAFAKELRAERDKRYGR